MMHLIKIWYTKGSLQLIQHSVPNVFFTIWNSCIDIDFSLEKHIIYFACDITYSIKSSINLPSLLPREKKNRWLIKRGRSRKCEDRGTSSRSCRGSMSLYRPPLSLRASFCGREVVTFFATRRPPRGWFIRIINRRDSHVETYAMPALPFVGGRTRQLYATHAGRAWFVRVKVLEHVTNLREPIFPYAYDPLDSYPEKSILLIELKGGFHCNN